MTQPASEQEIEVVARLVDPMAFRSFADMFAHCLRTGDSEADAVRYAEDTYGNDIRNARDKARSILSALSSLRGGVEGNGSSGAEGAAVPKSSAPEAYTPLNGWPLASELEELAWALNGIPSRPIVDGKLSGPDSRMLDRVSDSLKTHAAGLRAACEHVWSSPAKDAPEPCACLNCGVAKVAGSDTSDRQDRTRDETTSPLPSPIDSKSGDGVEGEK